MTTAPVLIVKQGDTAPALTATILDTTGAVQNLTGCTVTFTMQEQNATVPSIIAASPTVVNAATGSVSYGWATGETATPGVYQAAFHVAPASGSPYSFPNSGYLTVWVQENLFAGPQTIVTLAEAKDYLLIASTDRTHDQKLGRFIRAAQRAVEHVTGPIIVARYDEWYDGGGPWIIPRHRPVVTLISVSEYSGSVEYPLAIVADPAHGSIYSCMLDPDGRRIVRRSAGGTTQPFPAGIDTVFVQYTAGQVAIPENVREGTLELIRENYQQTQQGGRPGLNSTGVADVPSGPPEAFMSDRVRQMLVPNRRPPSVA